MISFGYRENTREQAGAVNFSRSPSGLVMKLEVNGFGLRFSNPEKAKWRFLKNQHNKMFCSLILRHFLPSKEGGSDEQINQKLGWCVLEFTRVLYAN